MSTIQKERATMYRDIKYATSIVEDATIQEAVEAVDVNKMSMNDLFGSDSESELDNVIDQIPTDDSQEEEELERIIQSDQDLEIDDIIGITNDIIEMEDDDESEEF